MRLMRDGVSCRGRRKRTMHLVREQGAHPARRRESFPEKVQRMHGFLLLNLRRIKPGQRSAAPFTIKGLPKSTAQYS